MKPKKVRLFIKPYCGWCHQASAWLDQHGIKYETLDVIADAAARKEMSAEYGAFTQSIIQSGHFKAGDGLQPTTTATTVRVRDGKTLTTDGPFAETREQLGGYYLVEAKDLDTAIAIAARIYD